MVSISLYGKDPMHPTLTCFTLTGVDKTTPIDVLINLSERWGYAGGLGPDTLATQLPRIAAAAGGQPVWVDMESRLRDAQDRFDIGAAARCLQAVDSFLAQSAVSGAA